MESFTSEEFRVMEALTTEELIDSELHRRWRAANEP